MKKFEIKHRFDDLVIYATEVEDDDSHQVRTALAGANLAGANLEGDDGFGLNAPRERIDWVIAGCESGPGARPCDVAWLRSLRDQCAAAVVPYFGKQAVPDRDRCEGCGDTIRYELQSRDDGLAWCGCTVEGPESCNTPGVWFGPGSKRKAGGVIELPYLDGVQHKEFPNADR